MVPLRWQPVYRRYLWGGRRLASMLGKELGEGDDYAESWEIVDREHDQSVVAYGPWQGETLRQLVAERSRELLGRHASLARFPLLFKFLDAHQTLSVQVHPTDEQAARRTPPDLGKTEAWLVLHAEPGSLIYAGLRSGVDRESFARALEQGTAAELLHSFTPKSGDCVFIPAGTVHALGAGTVVAEIQQSSDTTFRLFDWNRVGSDGRPRQLHLQEGLEVTDFLRGPVRPAVPEILPAPPGEHRERLVSCQYFVVERRRWSGETIVGGDDRCHLLVPLAGECLVERDPAHRFCRRGDTVLVPAACGPTRVAAAMNTEASLLDIYLP